MVRVVVVEPLMRPSSVKNIPSRVQEQDTGSLLALTTSVHVADPRLGTVWLTGRVASGRTPASAQIVTRYCGIPSATAAAVVVAHSDVMEKSAVDRSVAERVDCGIDEAYRWLAVRFSKFIRQSGEARPQRRRSART